MNDAVTWTDDTALSTWDIFYLSGLTVLQLKLSTALKNRMQHSCDTLQKVVSSGADVYGVTRGFGPRVEISVEPTDRDDNGTALVEHLAVGYGRPVSEQVTRAALLIRAYTVSRGWSAVLPEIFERYVQLLAYPGCVRVPETGSIGASGDLVPLSYLTRAMCGRGSWLSEGRVVELQQALPGYRFLENLGGRQALALTNGLSFSHAWSVIALEQSRIALKKIIELTGYLYATLGCSLEALDPALNRLKFQQGQAAFAQGALSYARQFNRQPDTSRPLQEPYSLRTLPQVMGAVIDQLDQAGVVLQAEIEGIDDNPLVIPADSLLTDETGGGDRVVHGGNFQGQYCAFAADMISTAVLKAAEHLERIVEFLLSPSTNGGAPVVLAWPGINNNGLAGVQLTVSALLAEMKSESVFVSALGLSTNAGNQDVVSMSAAAARRSHRFAGQLPAFVAAAGMAVKQLNFLRAEGAVDGHSIDNTPVWLDGFEGQKEDRGLHDILQQVSHAVSQPS